MKINIADYQLLMQIASKLHLLYINIIGEKRKFNKMINKAHIISRTEDLISSQIDNEIVMLSIENGKYYGLNSVGSHIWTLLEIPRSVEELCQTLMQNFEVSQEQCEQDVLTFLNTLATDNLVKFVNANT